MSLGHIGMPAEVDYLRVPFLAVYEELVRECLMNVDIFVGEVGGGVYARRNQGAKEAQLVRKWLQNGRKPSLQRSGRDEFAVRGDDVRGA